MTTQRDDLAKLVNSEGAWCGECDFGGWDSCADCRKSCLGFADAIIASDIFKPRTITTVEELDALAPDTTVRSAMGCVYVKDYDLDNPADTWWSCAGGGVELRSDRITLPATVLYEPTA